MRYSITKETPWPSFCTEIQEPTVAGNGGISVHDMHGMAGILNSDEDTLLVPGDGQAGYRGALILAMLLKLLLGLHLHRDRPEAHHVQGDVDLQIVMLYLNV